MCRYFFGVFLKTFTRVRVILQFCYIYDSDKNVCGDVEFGYCRAPVFLKFYSRDVYRLESIRINQSNYETKLRDLRNC